LSGFFASENKQPANGVAMQFRNTFHVRTQILRRATSAQDGFSHRDCHRVKRLVVLLRVTSFHVRTVERITELASRHHLPVAYSRWRKSRTNHWKEGSDVRVKDVECDEIWGYVGKKEGQKNADDENELGDAYCFVAVERNTKLVVKLLARQA